MTPLSDLECMQLAQIMNLKHAVARGPRVFSIAIEPEASHMVCKVTLANKEQSYYYPVQVRVESTKETARDNALLVLDYIDSYFEEFFNEDENVFLPIDWKEFVFEGTSFLMRGQILNLKAEKEVDALLAQEPL